MTAALSPPWERVATPFCKRAGGKTQLLPELRNRVPRTFGTYYEPFVGGGALFFDLVSHIGLKNAVLGDVSSELMTTYKAIRDNVEKLLEQLQSLVKQCGFDEDGYYTARAMSPTGRFSIAARFLYLNKTSFNGLYRVNKKGEFNVPWRRSETPVNFDFDNLRAVSKALKGVKLIEAGFQHTVEKAVKGDFAYFDCPYAPTNGNSFVMYDKAGFSYDDQVRLRDLAKALKRRGVKVLLSNSDVEAVRLLYKDGFKIERVEARRNINSSGTGRGKVGELLIT